MDLKGVQPLTAQPFLDKMGFPGHFRNIVTNSISLKIRTNASLQ